MNAKMEEVLITFQVCSFGYRQGRLVEIALRIAEAVRRAFVHGLGGKEIREVEEGLDAVFACAVLIRNLGESWLGEEIIKCSAEDFERIMVGFNYLVKFLDRDFGKVEYGQFIRHCILAPFGIRIIPESDITSNLPSKTHSIVQISSPLISI